MPNEQHIPRPNPAGRPVIILQGRFAGLEGVCLGQVEGRDVFAVSPNGEDAIVELEFGSGFGVLERKGVAATTLAAALRRCDELSDALKPFAREFASWTQGHRLDTRIGICELGFSPEEAKFTLADLHRAAALCPIHEEAEEEVTESNHI